MVVKLSPFELYKERFEKANNTKLDVSWLKMSLQMFSLSSCRVNFVCGMIISFAVMRSRVLKINGKFQC